MTTLTDDNLFDWGDDAPVGHPHNLSPKVIWCKDDVEIARTPKEDRRVHTMKVLAIEEYEPGKFRVIYKMLKDKTGKEHDYRIPKDNEPFIADAMSNEILEVGAEIAVTMLRKNKTWRWSKIKRLK